VVNGERDQGDSMFFDGAHGLASSLPRAVILRLPEPERRRAPKDLKLRKLC
jgi:hypothetical protein